MPLLAHAAVTMIDPASDDRRAPRPRNSALISRHGQLLVDHVEMLAGRVQDWLARE